MERLERDIGVAEKPARIASYMAFLEGIKAGQTWAFRLTANPTRSATTPGSSRGKRFGHVTAAQQIEWLLDRTEKNGFEIVPADLMSLSEDEHDELSLRLVNRQRPVFDKKASASVKQRVTINRATFEGILKVKNPDLFRALLVNGIGPSKAYGCGLMTLAKAM